MPAPEQATSQGAARDVPLVDFEDPDLTVTFSRPIDVASAVEHVVLENRETITEDREFTDWKKLAGELDAFVASVG